MLATARKLNRVVQIGTQRRSTPHLIEARDRSSRGQARQSRSGGDLLLLQDAESTNHRTARRPPPRLRNVDRPRAAASVQSAGTSTHLAAFMEYGNGIMGDMCVHMLDMTRWMLGLGWPRRIRRAAES
jgi:predicted dehydrogenase